MSDDIYEQMDFDKYIMVMSVNKPITAIRVMKNYPVWQDSEPYSYPQFVFGREEERDMVMTKKGGQRQTVRTVKQRPTSPVLKPAKKWPNVTIIDGYGNGNEGWLKDMQSINPDNELNKLEHELLISPVYLRGKKEILKSIMEFYQRLRDYISEHPEYYECSTM